MPTSVITRKGQITIPVGIRRDLGLKEGDRVSFERVGDAIQVRQELDVVARTAGVFREYAQHTRGMTIDEIIAAEKEGFEMGVAEGAIEEMNR